MSCYWSAWYAQWRLQKLARILVLHILTADGNAASSVTTLILLIIGFVMILNHVQVRLLHDYCPRDPPVLESRTGHSMLGRFQTDSPKIRKTVKIELGDPAQLSVYI
eukprot:3947696-Amphidinium_carterae.1